MPNLNQHDPSLPPDQFTTRQPHGGEFPTAFHLISTAFADGQTIPIRYTCDGAGGSPALSWGGGPSNTVTFALIADDPDAPSGIFTHWLLFNLPASSFQLAEDLPRTALLPNGGVQGRNDFGTIGYGAPCPPAGSPPHHYRFTLYALDADLQLDANATRQQMLAALRSHILDQTTLTGLYQRRK